MKKTLVALVLVSLLSISVQAADITMDASDAAGTSSFNSGLNWPGDLAPTAGNNYFTGNFRLRTPGNAGSYTFAGDSLTINNTNGYTASFMYKGTGTDATSQITVNNLILNGGMISHANASTNLFNLYGNINVASASTLYPKQGPINLYSAISGSAMLTIQASDSTPCKVWIRSSANTYTGNIVNNGRLETADDSNLNFVIGASGINNNISNGTLGTQQHSMFGGDFIFDLTGASATYGDSWQVINTVAASTYYLSTFNVAGFTAAGDNNRWFKAIDDTLNYKFTESTGTLSVVPEPATMLLLGLGGPLVSRKKR